MMNQQVFLAKQVRENEGPAAKRCGVTLYELMERAGQATYQHLLNYFPDTKKFVVLTGVGNNAGDGYVVARLAKHAGMQVTVIAAKPEQPLKGDALTAQQAWLELGGTITADLSSIKTADIIIDGLLGTGIQSEVREPFAQLIKAANESQVPVVAIDLPSGINADTGVVQGVAIKAALTVTFVGIKQGLVTGQGRAHTGELEFADLAIQDAFLQLTTPTAELINYKALSRLPKRDNNSHKTSHGKLLCIGGNAGTAGAIRLTAEAALRTGAGMVKVYTHSSSILPVSIGRPEIMVTDTHLISALEWASCIAIGPGLGQDAWSETTFETVMQYCFTNNKPLVIDADALNLIAQHASSFPLANTVITPHPGEAARLLNCHANDIEENRFHAVKQLARSYTTTCVLKGAGSLIADKNQTWVCTDGNPALAVGGSGDVLTGIIAALIAQGLTTQQAACLGVCLHAKAGDIAAERDGERGMLPSDLFAIVRELVN
ncbi:NAD(P)H-hydrate dehydratase [Pseudoalteromonas sp. SYSU M81236]|uniref:NAD(P)H-hydrate dehydratase n=1 Tax=Pseudoalteromonas sp. SYSU M81236 TaxID=3447014 RepID=UPI003F121C54